MKPRCHLCGCTEEHACPGGCGWIDQEETLCSACTLQCLGQSARLDVLKAMLDLADKEGVLLTELMLCYREQL